MAKRLKVGDRVAYKNTDGNASWVDGRTGTLIRRHSTLDGFAIRWDATGHEGWAYSRNLVHENDNHISEANRLIAEANELAKRAEELLDTARALVDLESKAKKLGYALTKI